MAPCSVRHRTGRGDAGAPEWAGLGAQELHQQSSSVSSGRSHRHIRLTAAAPSESSAHLQQRDIIITTLVPQV